MTTHHGDFLTTCDHPVSPKNDRHYASLDGTDSRSKVISVGVSDLDEPKIILSGETANIEESDADVKCIGAKLNTRPLDPVAIVAVIPHVAAQDATFWVESADSVEPIHRLCPTGAAVIKGAEDAEDSSQDGTFTFSASKSDDILEKTWSRTSTVQLIFTAENWNSSQMIIIQAGEDVTGPGNEVDAFDISFYGRATFNTYMANLQQPVPTWNDLKQVQTAIATMGTHDLDYDTQSKHLPISIAHTFAGAMQVTQSVRIDGLSTEDFDETAQVRIHVGLLRGVYIGVRTVKRYRRYVVRANTLASVI